MVVDKFGILKLNETKSGGLEWFNKWNNGQSRTLNEGDRDPYDSKFFLLCGQPNIPLLIDGTGRAIVKAYSSSVRLFVEGPWLNTEMTVYVKGMTTCNDVQLRSRSNHEKQCCFGNYVANWQRVQKKISIEVEPLHPIYKRHLDEHSFDGFQLTHYVGFKQVTRTIDGNNKVKVEGWVNDSANDSMDQTQWVKQTEFTFDGNNVSIPVATESNLALLESCKNKGDLVANDNPINKATCFLCPGQWCWIRLNSADQTRLKYFSVREIDPI